MFLHSKLKTLFLSIAIKRFIVFKLGDFSIKSSSNWRCPNISIYSELGVAIFLEGTPIIPEVRINEWEPEIRNKTAKSISVSSFRPNCTLHFCHRVDVNGQTLWKPISKVDNAF